MGYDGVEFAHSYYGHEAPAIRKLLDDNGLACCGMHMGLPMLDGEAFDATVKIHKTPRHALPHHCIAAAEEH